MLKSSRVLEIILFLFSLFLYIHNLSRSIYAGDTGLLVTAAYTGGVAHPPGYPLFTLLGLLLSRVGDLMHWSPAFSVGLISAIVSALAVVIYFRIAMILTTNKVVSFVSSLTLATVFIFWFYAVIPEVFALNNFFVLLLLYLALLYTKTKSTKIFLLLGLTLGLSLTNHLTIVLLIPSLVLILYPYFLKDKSERKDMLLRFGAAVIIGLLPYLYIVIASLRHPSVDWANITDIKSFLSFVLRERYGTFKAGAFADLGTLNRLLSLKLYAVTIIIQLTLSVTLLGLLGGLIGVFQRKRIEMALLLAILLSGPLFVVYAGFPLVNAFSFGVEERFVSMSAVIFLLYLPLGLQLFSTWLGKRFSRPLYTVLFAGIFILVPLQLFVFNFSRTDLSTLAIGDTFGKNYLNSLPPQSILLLTSDTSYFNTLYVHTVAKVRPDVMLLNAADPIQANKTLYQMNNKLSVTDDDKQQQIVLLANLFEADKSRPVFSEVSLGKNSLVEWVPYGLVYELHRADEAKLSQEQFKAQSASVWKKIELPLNRNLKSVSARNLGFQSIYDSYAWSLWHTATYFYSEYKDAHDYANYLLTVTEVNPEFAQAYAGLGTYFLTVENDCQRGLINYKQANEKDPTNKSYFQLLAIGYERCHTKGDAVSELENEYEQIFHESLKTVAK